IQEAALKPEYFISNKANLYRAHLVKYENFKTTFTENEVAEILRQKNSSTNSNNKKFHCLISSKDIPYLENLVLRICISNGLPFSFIENEETKTLFDFIMPGLKLPDHKKLGRQILNEASKNLQDEILKIMQNDINSITTVFDGWINMKYEHI
ncbi:17209_t:CDS:2, partial [Racocetra persica]